MINILMIMTTMIMPTMIVYISLIFFVAFLLGMPANLQNMPCVCALCTQNHTGMDPEYPSSCTILSKRA